ncbi:COG2104 Sulfur transfer protein involved in thiamine biosynthesis [Vibrio sp. B1FLJ16]|uniref:sulfur carrier protein ThiS n=1 Tax=Vibrio sp. B1FLJ16 TaxID=2751178 RepID=UPI0015F5784A|nr:sulfur carrier protein ThiS [Vibrio sp. B1FLJ16]CAD7814010.1 COG2104 Sulfur transfer protein involved in thiamine biosynthesis [Vibrio sp. B1FLJ16]CAE6921624.1 COG2104 Sulfur transfer protein involved in thiamine biosynthesis [Vibrio sp. B1FLJ16]
MTSSKHDAITELDASCGKGKLVVIAINDQPQQVESNVNLQQIITQFSLPEVGCVFAINNQVVPRSEWASTILSEGDTISLFQAIAGG